MESLRRMAVRLQTLGIALWFWLALCSAAHAADNRRLIAAVEPPAIRAGEVARFTLNFENCFPDEVPALPAIPNLAFSRGGEQRSFQIVNGRQTTVYTLVFGVSASQPGEYTIPAIQAVADGQRLSSSPVKLRVLAAGQQPAPDTAGTPPVAFLKLVVPKTELYVGEVLPVEIQFYYISAQDLQLPPLSAEGFTFGKMITAPDRGARIGNATYKVHTRQVAATPTKTGKLKLGPAECRVKVAVATARRRSADPFDDFFSDPFGRGYELREVKLASDPVELEVKPLPAEGVPAGFGGAVGEFTFNVAASPTNIAVGEPVKLRVEVRGRGALENIQWAPPEKLADFKVYPPITRVETTDALGIEGARIIEQDLVPESPDVRELPPLQFVYFNPSSRTYQTLTRPALPLVVRPAGAPQALAGSGQPPAGSPVPPQDIVHVKARPGSLAVLAPPLLRQPWFLWLQAVPVLLCAGAYGWRRWQEHLATHPRLVRRQAVARLVRQGLTDLERLADASQSDEFHALMFRLLQEQLGERLDLPAAAITEAILEDQLKPRGVDPQKIEFLHGLFQACNQARYAPLSAPQDLRALIPRLAEGLKSVQQLDLDQA